MSLRTAGQKDVFKLLTVKPDFYEHASKVRSISCKKYLIMDGEPLKTVTNDREVKRGSSKGAGVSKLVCYSEPGG